MAKIYWESSIYPQFMSGIDSCSLSDLTNQSIQTEIDGLIIKAIADFKFPFITLEYKYDSDINPLTEVPFGFYFVGDITQREYNVLLARMKQYWIEHQVSQERLFQNVYFDSEIRLHSPGNTIDKLIKLYVTFKEVADRAEHDYYRVFEGKPSIGDING